MSRRKRRLLILLGAVVAVAFTLTLQVGERLVRIPGDLVACEPEGTWLTSANEQLLPDGSGRELRLEPGGVYQLVRAEEAVAHHVDKPTGHLLGITPDLRAVVYEPGFPTARPKNPEVAAITAFGIGEHGIAPPQTTRLPLPKTVRTVADGVLSPDGQQVAWCLVSEYERPGVGLLRRFSPTLADRFPPHRMWEVWLSRTDGSHLRELATAPETPFDGWHAPPSTPTEFLTVGWSRKTGQLQLAYHGTRYRLR